MKLCASIVSVAVILLASVSCDHTTNGPTPEPFQIKGDPVFRVQVVDDRSTPFEVASEGAILVYEIPNGRVEGLIGEFSPGAVRIESGDRGVVIGGETEQFPDRCRLVPEPGHHFVVRPDVGKSEQYRYRGVLDVFKHSGVLRVINELSVEEYLLGVVGKEMQGVEFTLEALKAQAVVARTFTLYHLRASGAQPVDRPFPATTDFQSYGGANYETELVVQAVRETRGQVLTFGSKLFQSYYHSTCGGQTASGRIFNEQAIEPLAGVECGFCVDTSTYQWKALLDAGKLEKELRLWAVERDIAFGRLLGLAPVDVDPSGHGTYVRVRHSRGAFEIRADRLRAVAARSGQRLPSSRFQAILDARAREFHVKGQGHGHGVGLCQRGAGVMALDHDCGEILARYFPQSGLDEIY